MLHCHGYSKRLNTQRPCVYVQNRPSGDVCVCVCVVGRGGGQRLVWLASKEQHGLKSTVTPSVTRHPRLLRSSSAVLCVCDLFYWPAVHGAANRNTTHRAAGASLRQVRSGFQFLLLCPRKKKPFQTWNGTMSLCDFIAPHCTKP